MHLDCLNLILCFDERATDENEKDKESVDRDLPLFCMHFFDSFATH